MFENFALAATLLSGSSFTPAALFAGGEVGAWYDPSDLTTLFQDSAGSTPVTAVEQPVGLMRDKSGRGNHASQATAASRPVLSARYNLLTRTEEFDNVAWVKTGATVTANQGTDPLGGNTADKFAAAVGGNVTQQNVVTTSGVNYTFTIWIKGITAAGTCGIYFSNPQPSPTNAATVSFTTSWQKFTLTGNATSGTTYVNIGTWDVLNNGPTQDILIWGADFRVTNDGVNLPSYQRVVTGATNDYDTAGFPLYLKFDGVDDSLSTASIDMSATNKVSVFAGLRKQSDAAQGIFAEFTADLTLNNGGFCICAPDSAATNFNFASKGTTKIDNIITPYTSPTSAVITGLGDIGAPSNIIRLNGSQIGAAVTTSQGTGNYANAALNIGRRGGATLPFNGRLYSLIVRGAPTSADQLSRAEAWVNGKTGAY